MTAYVFRLTGCYEQLLLDSDTPLLPDLAWQLSCGRFQVGRLVAANGEATSQGMLVAVSRIETILEPEQPIGASLSARPTR
jgi:hypothetical protein